MLEKKYYDGTQVHRIISEEVKDYETIMKILKRFADEPSARGTNLAEVGTDMISRQAAIDAFLTELTKRERKNLLHTWSTVEVKYFVVDMLEKLPSAQPEPLSDAYMKAVWAWLLNYQIKAAELKGRYTPYEVLSWVANDWRKEHERSD